MIATRFGNLQQTASVAAVFWCICLFLVALEATIGENPVSSWLFLVSVPALVTGRSITVSRDPASRPNSGILSLGELQIGR